MDLTDKEVELLAHNIMIIAHAWTFRRWELQKRFTLEEYTDMQIRFLLHGMEENATKGGF